MVDSYKLNFLKNSDNFCMCSHCPFNRGIHDTREILEPCGEDHCLVEDYEPKNETENSIVTN